MATIDTNAAGQKAVEIDTVIFSGKRKIAWNRVEDYLKKYIGNEYVIDETGDVICIGSDFPDEYANSKYSTKAYGTIGKAKANASQVIPELVKIATNISFQGRIIIRHAYDGKKYLYDMIDIKKET